MNSEPKFLMNQLEVSKPWRWAVRIPAALSLLLVSLVLVPVFTFDNRSLDAGTIGLGLVFSPLLLGLIIIFGGFPVCMYHLVAWNAVSPSGRMESAPAEAVAPAWGAMGALSNRLLREGYLEWVPGAAFGSAALLTIHLFFEQGFRLDNLHLRGSLLGFWLQHAWHLWTLLYVLLQLWLLAATAKVLVDRGERPLGSAGAFFTMAAIGAGLWAILIYVIVPSF